MKKIYLYALILVIAVSSCKKFLEENSQNDSYIESVSDLDELLIGECYSLWHQTPTVLNILNYGSFDWLPWLHVMDDDASEFAYNTWPGGTPSGPMGPVRELIAGFHYWQPQPFSTQKGDEATDINWAKYYRRVAVLNGIILQIPALSGKSDKQDAQLKRIEGEAYYLRAFNYFMLVNIYGAPYKVSTAATDPGVPLKLSPDVEDKFFKRNSVKEIYDQMVSDLKHAGLCLKGVKQASKYRANQAAAYTLLSRVCLYMEDYQQTITYADSVINSGDYTLNNLNGYVTGVSFNKTESPEVIFSQGDHGGYLNFFVMGNDYTSFGTSSFGYASSYCASDELVGLYNKNDIRRDAFFSLSSVTRRWIVRKYRRPLENEAKALINPSTNTVISKVSSGGEVSDKYMLRLSEDFLNKAEAQVMLGREAEARATVQQLRSNRFTASNLTAITASGTELISFIRDERRRELCFEGHRWFDLRRYGVNSVNAFSKTIRHYRYEYRAGQNDMVAVGFYELKPYDQDKAAYIIPVPNNEIDFNQGNIVNAIRTDREATKL